MPRNGNRRLTRRLSLVTSERVRERMERLMEETDAESITEVIRRALAVYEVLVDRTRDADTSVVIKEADGTETPVALVP